MTPLCKQVCGLSVTNGTQYRVSYTVVDKFIHRKEISPHLLWNMQCILNGNG